MTTILHGGQLTRLKDKYPDYAGDWLDLSTGLNPVPWPWIEKIPESEILEASARLPDEDLVLNCRNAWAEYLAVQDANEWTLAAGSQAVINLLPHLFPAHNVCLLDPTYGEHVRVWQKAGRQITRLDAQALLTTDFPPNQVLILTNPNNPDGCHFDPDQLLALAARMESQQGFIVVDEAFADVAPDVSVAARKLPPNMIVLRSFGKFFGLAGVRIGMFRAAPELREKLQILLGPWPVNGLALAIAGYALKDQKWIKAARQRLVRDGNRLKEILISKGVKVIGSTDLFCLTDCSDAAAISNELAQQGIYVRAFLENHRHLRFGLPATNQDFERLKNTLDNIENT